MLVDFTTVELRNATGGVVARIELPEYGRFAASPRGDQLFFLRDDTSVDTRFLYAG